MSIKKRCCSAILAATMLSGIITQASAVGTEVLFENNISDGTDPIISEVVIPAQITLQMDKTGAVSVKEKDLKLSNTSQTSKATVKKISVVGKQGFSIADYSSDLESKPEGTKEIALQFNGDGTTSSGDVVLTSNWEIEPSNDKALTINAKMPKQPADFEVTGGIATINWEIDTQGPDQSIISNDWDRDLVLENTTHSVVFTYDSTNPSTYISNVYSINPDVAIITTRNRNALNDVEFGNEKQAEYNVEALSVGETKIVAVLNTGESTEFIVNTYKIDFDGGEDGGNTINVPKIPDKEPGDKLETGDIIVDIPITTPDGDDTITVTPEIPEDTVLSEGDNNIDVTVDLDGDLVAITLVVPVDKKDTTELYYTFTDDPSTGGWKVGLTSGFKAALNRSWAQQGQYLEWDSTESIPVLPAVYKGKPVTNVSGMFMGMTAMEHLIISEWDTSNVVDMSSLFSNCTGLTQISLQNMDTSKVTTMNQMFYKCEKLNGGFNTSLDELETDSVTDMTSMFKLCKSLVNFDCDWNTSNVDSMQSMFEYCNKLYMIDLSSFTLKSGVNLKSMFNDCTALRTCWGSWANYDKFNDQWTTKLPDGVEFDYR